jgi:hypothetical protein
MTHREHLAQADRFIAECKNRMRANARSSRPVMKTVTLQIFLCRCYERWRKTCVPSRGTVT